MLRAIDLALSLPQSSPPMRGAHIPPFYAGLVGRRTYELARAGRTIIPMHFGQPTAGAPPAALAAARAALERDAMGYWESSALAERIARFYGDEHDVDVPAGRVLLAAGASAALIATFAACFSRGDRVAVTRPGYPAYRNSLVALGLTPVELICSAADGFRPTAKMLAAIDPPPAGFVLASPANPTGAMVDRTELEAIVAVCRERSIQLISDEIYHGITFGAPSVSALEIDARAIVINSFSKRYRMPGWRLGWIVAPDALVERLRAYLINFFLTPSSIAQHAALAAFEDSDELSRSVREYAANRAMLVDRLPRIGFGEVTPPAGAFYVYADVRHLTNDSLRFCLDLLNDTGVGFAPGIDFDPEDGQGFVRLSFAVSTRETEQAIDLLARWLAERAALQ